LRLLFSVLTGIIVIIVAVIFVGPPLISTENLRNQLFAQVESATGYRLRVSGPVDITLFPSIDLVAEDVGISQPASGSAAEFAKAKELRVGLMLGPLLSGKVQMTELTLIDPVIAIPQARTDGSGPGQGEGSGGKSVAEKLKSLSLDKLTIENGTVILPASGDAKGQKRISGIMLEASLPSFDAPLTFDAKANFDSKPIQAAGSIDRFGRFLEGASAPVSISFDGPAYLPEKATLTATVTYLSEVLTLAKFTAKSGDKLATGNAVYKDSTLTVTQLAGRAGEASFAAGNAVYKDGALTVANFNAKMGDKSASGSATYKDNIVRANPITATIAGNTFSGSVAADISGKVPNVNVALSGQTLNIDALLGKPGAAHGGGGGATAAGWSDAKIDFSPLRMVNGKFKLTAKQLIYGNIKLANATINATLSGGKLAAELPSFGLYGGAGKLAANIDAGGNTPSQKINLSLANFDAYPFLKDAAGFQSLEGKGTIALDIATAGASQRAMVSALGGTAKLDFADGAIRGINIAKTVRNLTTGIVTGWQGSGNEKTDFASLGASFTITKGQAQTKDLHLVGPLVRMAGAGSIDLPGRTLKMRVDPKLVASFEGQGGKGELQGLGVPIVIAGPWAAPKFYPDIAGILNDPAAAYQQLQNFGKGLVKLPGLNEIDKTGTLGGLPGVVKDGKIDQDALRDTAIQGIGTLLGAPQLPATQPVAPAPKPAAVVPKAKPKEATAKPKEPAAGSKSKQATTGGKPKEQATAGKPKELKAGAKPKNGDKPKETATGGKPKPAEGKPKKASAEAAGDSEEIDAEDAVKELLPNLLGN
jgi:AsmA protein